jgi:hypothetical protein
MTAGLAASAPPLMQEVDRDDSLRTGCRDRCSGLRHSLCAPCPQEGCEPIAAPGQGFRGQPAARLRSGRGTHHGECHPRQRRRRPTVPVGTSLRGLAWIDAESPCQRRQGAHRQDQQGRRSLFACTTDPRGSSHRRNELPQGCGTAALAEAAARAAIGECCGGRGCPQDGTSALGDDHPRRRLSKDCRSDGIRGMAPNRTLAPACEGDTT